MSLLLRECSHDRHRTFGQKMVGGAGAGEVRHVLRSWLMSVVLATTCVRRFLHRTQPIGIYRHPSKVSMPKQFDQSNRF